MASEPGYGNEKEQVLKPKVSGLTGWFQRLNQTRHKRPMLELLLYIIFLVVLMIYAVKSSPGNDGYFFSSRVTDVLIEEEFSGLYVEKSYLDIGEREEFWQFMNGPFFSAFYGFDPAKGHRSRIFEGNFVIDSIYVE